MSLVGMILRKVMPVPRPEEFSRALFLGPHPDDIEIGAGATAARMAAEGKSVTFLVVTDGRFGTENADLGLPPEELADLREREARRSAAVLGVTDVRFLRLSDGGFYTDEELRRGIAAVMGEVQPEVVFAPDPVPRNECHPDHLRVGRAAGELVCFGYNRGIFARLGAGPSPARAVAYYMTGRPNRYVRTSGLLARQRAAIRCHKSLFPPESGALRDVCLYLKLRAAQFGLRSGHRAAEGFRVLGNAQMHVLSEFGE